jgi:hypothetical protein
LNALGAGLGSALGDGAAPQREQVGLLQRRREPVAHRDDQHQ